MVILMPQSLYSPLPPRKSPRCFFGRELILSKSQSGFEEKNLRPYLLVPYLVE
jgi:hypothetical protein